MKFYGRSGLCRWACLSFWGYGEVWVTSATRPEARGSGGFNLALSLLTAISRSSIGSNHCSSYSCCLYHPRNAVRSRYLARGVPPYELHGELPLSPLAYRRDLRRSFLHEHGRIGPHCLAKQTRVLEPLRVLVRARSQRRACSNGLCCSCANVCRRGGDEPLAIIAVSLEYGNLREAT